MLDAVFGFGGRINRLQYFLGCVGLVAGMIGLGATAFGAMGFHAPTSLSPSLGVALLIVLLGALAFIWISFSLQARRFRDMGWNPLVAILGVIAIDIVDQMVARAVPSLSVGGLQHQTMIGGLINLAVSGCLLFWPGADGAGPKLAASPKSAKPDRPARAQPLAAPVRAAPVWNVDQPRTGFGRRGL